MLLGKQLGKDIPDLELDVYTSGKMEKVKLSKYKGKWVVLFFYPLDFTFVCPTEIRGFAARETEFSKHNAVILGASTDSVFSHKNWIERDMPEVKFPIVGDTNHALAHAFDVMKQDQGITYRGTFIIDPEGVVRYEVVSDLTVGRSVEETLRVVQALQTGDFCPMEWKPGQKTLGK